MLPALITLLRRALVLVLAIAAGTAHAVEHHCLWRVAGKHNTVYLLGSIHVLRDSDYPLPGDLLDAYTASQAIMMEIDLNEMDSEQVQQQMLSAAALPAGKTVQSILGPTRYQHAQTLAAAQGMDLALFEQFAPWFVAEAISQMQLMQMGFAPTAGVEMYFLERARSDGKPVRGLESAHDQIDLFESMSDERQADYLISSLEESANLPKEVDAMVDAWRHGDTRWFEAELQREFGRDPRLYQSVVAARNRKWIPKIEALLNQDRNVLVIVGAGHLAGNDSVIALLRRDGISATQD
jgi:uncharacterized protein